MIRLYGIDFPEDEVQVTFIEGEPQWIVSIAGARRLAERAPDINVRDAYLALLDKIEGGHRG